MYVCVCKAVSDRRIRALAAEGRVRSLADLRRETGLGTCCGRCVPCARDVLAEAVREASGGTAAPLAAPAAA